MSKEMTPKESLEFIIDTFNKLAQKPQDIGLMFKFCEAHEKINQALDRLEVFEKENQDLRDKLNINFEDCADELCEALTQRDKLYDENLELKKEIENKDKAFEILNNLCESQTKVIGKYEKVIDILKKKKVNVFHIWVFDTYEQYKEHYPFAEYYASEDMLTKDEFTFLKEFLE